MPPNFQMVALSLLFLGPNVRQLTDEDQEDIERLAKNIKTHGLHHPLLVRGVDGRFEVIAGQRRFLACQIAGLTEVPCRLLEGELTEADILLEQLAENLHRSNLSTLDEARRYRRLMDLNGWTAKVVASRLHVSTSKVSRALSVTRLAPELQGKVQAGEVGSRAAAELARIDDPEAQRQLAEQIANGQANHQDVARAARTGAKKPSKGEPKT